MNEGRIANIIKGEVINSTDIRKIEVTIEILVAVRDAIANAADKQAYNNAIIPLTGRLAYLKKQEEEQKE